MFIERLQKVVNLNLDCIIDSPGVFRIGVVLRWIVSFCGGFHSDWAADGSCEQIDDGASELICGGEETAL